MSWKHLDTRYGQLIEMACVLSNAKDTLQRVLDDYPAEAGGRGRTELEEAISLIGRSEVEIDDAAEVLA